MPFRVVLDANVVLAACLDPAMDAKAGTAEQVFATLKSEGMRPAVTEGIEGEIEDGIRERVGQVLDALRNLANRPVGLAPGQTSLGILEDMFAELRRSTGGAGGALQVLETQLAGIVKDEPLLSVDQWNSLFNNLATHATDLLAEVQRRKDALNLDVLARAGKADHDRFRAFVPKSDLEHIAVLAAIAEVRRHDVVFVTMDGPLHGARDAITREAPRLIVTTPPYLRRQIDRLRASA